MVPCGVDDLNPRHDDAWIDLWPQIAPLIMCLENFQEIALFGNYKQVEFASLDIKLVRCTDMISCKNETEINDFIDENGNIMMYTNTVNYNTEIYTDLTL